MLSHRIRFAARSRQSGFSLFELIIAIVISIVILTVMMRAFTRASNEISKGRSIMELSAQLRSTSQILRSDLENVTLVPSLWNQTADSPGYFEIVEGVDNDTTRIGTAVDYFGDFDDVLAMTVRSDDRPFRGRLYNPNTGVTSIVESNLAEVVWFVNYVDIDNAGIDTADRITLYRKVLLIRPDLDLSIFGNITRDNFWQNSDISVRQSGNEVRPNSLSDLTKREHRYSHANAFPHAITNLAGKIMTGDYEGDDILMSDIAAFDIRVYSPNATVYVDSTSSYVVSPGDNGYPLGGGATFSQQGAFVDLGYTAYAADPNAATVWFASAAHTRSQLSRTWCSWSLHYEYDNQDQDGDMVTDEGTDGLDNDAANGVDDENERETQPPYAHPIRAVEISIRAVEKSRGTVRQSTVVSSFVPQ